MGLIFSELNASKNISLLLYFITKIFIIFISSLAIHALYICTVYKIQDNKAKIKNQIKNKKFHLFQSPPPKRVQEKQ